VLSEAVAELGRGLNTPFDAHRLLEALSDADSWVEMGRLHAGECITGFCRFEGLSAGVVASNAAVRGGILHPETCRKMTRFIRLCSTFGLPLIFLADTPGFMVGEAVERGGMVQAAGDLFTAIEHCTGPKVCVVVRKAYSAGLYAMAGPGFGGTLWAVPGASISIFGPEALRRFEPGQRDSGLGRESYDEIMAGATDPRVLVDQGLVDELVPWDELRRRLAVFAGEAHGRLQQTSHAVSLGET
jgi:acetyl-CoA carboxylase carboxyltransferase component